MVPTTPVSDTSGATSAHFDLVSSDTSEPHSAKAEKCCAYKNRRKVRDAEKAKAAFGAPTVSTPTTTSVLPVTPTDFFSKSCCT